MRCVVLVAAVACGPRAGSFYAPGGVEPIRTAKFTLNNQRGELVLILSNGAIACAKPEATDEAQYEEQLSALATATCREGAQHVVLRLVDPEDAWDGVYVGTPDVDALAAGSRGADGGWWSVDESRLVALDGLLRGYAATQVSFVPLEGDGSVTLTLSGDSAVAEGTFRLGGGLVQGEFRAERCTGDTSLVDVAALAGPIDVCLAGG